MAGNKLGDYFSKEYARENSTTYTYLEKGTVIRMHVKDTIPPKTKLFVVVGLHENQVGLGTLYINSEINSNVNFTTELQDLQYKISCSDYSFLSWDSYVDCTIIREKDNSELIDIVNNDGTKVIGKLEDGHFQEIKDKLIGSATIKGKHKKKFGLYAE